MVTKTIQIKTLRQPSVYKIDIGAGSLSELGQQLEESV